MCTATLCGVTEVEGFRVWERRTPLRDALAVLRAGLVVLRRHWPVLCAVSFAGQAARSFIDEGAVRLSHVNALAGLMVFILVPIATLCVLTLMVWTVRTSLPSVSSLTAYTSPWRLLNTVGSVLVPFLAVYTAYGYLQADRSEYVYAVWLSDPTGPLAIPTRITVSLVVVVIVAVALRALLLRWSWAKDHGWVGIFRAYLEVTWIAIAGSIIGPIQDAVTAWLSDRRVVQDGTVIANQAKGWGAPAHFLIDWLGAALESTDTVILVPLSWLAVGAVIYGSSIEDEDLLISPAVARWLARMPTLVRRALLALRGSIVGHFGELINGVRLLRRSGLTSMLLYCLLFLVVQTSSIWLFMLERTLIGPRDLSHFWMPVSNPLSVFNDAIQMVLLVCLLGAAVDRVLRRQPKHAPAVTSDDDDDDDDPGDDTGGGPAVSTFDAPTMPQQMVPLQRALRGDPRPVDEPIETRW